MKKFLFALVACLFIGHSVYAQQTTVTVTLEGLNDDQTGQVISLIGKFKAANAAAIAQRDAPPPVPANDIATTGQKIGAALAATASQMNMDTKTFLSSPVADGATHIIYWKILGAEILHVSIGVVWLIVAIPIWFYLYRRTCIIESEEFAVDDKGKRYVSNITTYGSNRDDARWAFFFVMAAIIVVSQLIIWTY